MIIQRAPELDLVRCLLVIFSLEVTSPIYLPWKEEPKESSRAEPEEHELEKEDNQIYRHHETSHFRYDEDILRYLRISGRQLMIWRCRNAVKPYWNHATGVVPFVDLYCSVIGSVATVDWYHRNKKIQSDAERPSHKYERARKGHEERGRHFTRWTDFRLRIHNVTRSDSGMYRFEVKGPEVKGPEVRGHEGGQVDQQFIFVDVSGTKWSGKNYHKKRKKKRKKTKKAIKLWHSPLTMDLEEN